MKSATYIEATYSIAAVLTLLSKLGLLAPDYGKLQKKTFLIRYNGITYCWLAQVINEEIAK